MQRADQQLSLIITHLNIIQIYFQILIFSMVQTRNLGQIAAIVHSYNEPENKRILWYDLSLEGIQGTKCPIKYYNQTTSQWELLIK